MVPAKTNTKKKSIFWGSGIAALLAIVFFASSIYSVRELSISLRTLVNHPFRVASAAYDVRFAVSQMALRMRELITNHQPNDLVVTREFMSTTQAGVANNILYMYNYYLGPRSDVERIAASLETMYTDQEKILELAEGLSDAEIEERVAEQLGPLHREVYADIENHVLVFISGTVNRLSTQASNILHSNVMFSGVIGLLAVVVVTLFLWSTRRRQEEKDARDRLFQIIAENVGNVFMVYDVRHKKMDYVSPNARNILGISNSVLFKSASRVFATCSPRCTEIWEGFFGDKGITEPQVHECGFIMPETGEERLMLVSLYPVWEQGVVSLYVFSISDLTEDKKNQQALKDALVIAQNANNAKSIFLSRMSHEIRTPMNAIIGMATIAAGVLDDKKRMEDCLAKIGTSSRHLLLLINDVLDMSRIESGKLSIAHEVFGAASLINGMTAIIYPQAKANGLELEVVADIKNEKLYGDSLRLNQVLLNLLSNALKFTPRGGKICLNIAEMPSHEPRRTRLRFTITDTGIGMSPEFLDRLFDPFEQEHTNIGNSPGGTGLGMSITRNILSLMGGTIRVQSERGKGTCFIAEVDFDMDEHTEQRMPRQLRELKVMVVDDDPNALEHASLILQRMGISVLCVLSGEDAVPLVVSAHESGLGYDVVFMDWSLPGIDGVEATRRIRKQVGPDTLIIIISAYDWADIEVEAREAGVNDFISKPMFQSTVYNTLLRVTGGQAAEVELDKAPLCLEGKRLLLVEDNAINCEIAQEILKGTKAHVDTVYNGQEAVDVVAASAPGTYAAVLMDVQMPVMNGYEATKAIRKLPQADAKTLPIIAMTANAFREDVVAAMEAGMNGHISKPVDVYRLFDTLRELIYVK